MARFKSSTPRKFFSRLMVFFAFDRHLEMTLKIHIWRELNAEYANLSANEWILRDRRTVNMQMEKCQSLNPVILSYVRHFVRNWIASTFLVRKIMRPRWLNLARLICFASRGLRRIAFPEWINHPLAIYKVYFYIPYLTTVYGAHEKLELCLKCSHSCSWFSFAHRSSLL